jgi:hypothetical protein
MFALEVFLQLQFATSATREQRRGALHGNFGSDTDRLLVAVNRLIAHASQNDPLQPVIRSES